MNLFSLKKTRGVCVPVFIAVFSCVMGGYQEDVNRYFPQRHTVKWTTDKEKPLQIPGKYQEKVFYNGDRSVIGMWPRAKGNLHPSRYS